MRPCSIRVARSPYPPLRLGGLFHVKHSFLVDSSGDASAPPDHPTPRLRAFALRGLAAERGFDDLFRLRSIRGNSFAGAGLRVRANCAHASLHSFRLPLRFIWERMFHVKHSFPLCAPRPPRSCCQVFRLLRRARVPCALLRARALAPSSARRRPASLLPSPGASRPSARVLALVFVRARHLSLAPHSSARNACLPRILAPPSLFSASHLCRDPVPAAPLPPPPFRTTSTFATLRSHPLSRGFALLFRLALALHSCPAPAFRPSNPPLPAKNCYGTILIVP